MIMFASELDLAVLKEEARNLKYYLDGSGAEMATKPSSGIPDIVKQLPTMLAAIHEIAKKRETPALHVMVNWLKPGIEVPEHRDWILPTKHQTKTPCVERWHLPIITNEDCAFWDEDNGEFYMPEGIWCGFVPYWLKHKVWNRGKTDRLHLVVDLDSPHPLGSYIN